MIDHLFRRRVGIRAVRPLLLAMLIALLLPLWAGATTTVETKDIIATKVWDESAVTDYLASVPGSLPQPNQVIQTTTWFQLWRKAEGVDAHAVPGAKLLELKDGITEVTWKDMPVTTDGAVPYEYFVKEVKDIGTAAAPRYVNYTPPNTTKVEDGLTVTNTFFPVKSGVIEDKPCSFNWYAEAFMSVTDEGFPNNNYTWKVSKGFYSNHKGQLEVQHFMLGKELAFRVPVATDYAMKNVKLEIIVAPEGDPWMPKGSDIAFFNDYFFERFAHTSQKGSTHKNTRSGTLSPAEAGALIYDIGDLPANSGFLFQVAGIPEDYSTDKDYYMGVRLTGEYECYTVEKQWTDDNPGKLPVTLRLSADQAYIQAIEAAVGTGEKAYKVYRDENAGERPMVVNPDDNSGELQTWARNLSANYPAASELLRPTLAQLWADATWSDNITSPTFVYGGRTITKYKEATITIPQAALDQLVKDLTEAYTGEGLQVTIPADAATGLTPPHTFGPIPFVDGAGEPITYTLTEEDIPGYQQQGEVEYTETAPGHLKAVITNAPKPLVELAFAAEKELQGATLQDKQFSFLLNLDATVLRAENDADGLIQFDPIQVEAPGEYVFTMNEVKGSVPGYTYSDTSYRIEVALAVDPDTDEITQDIVIYKGNETKPHMEGELPLFVNSYTAPAPQPTPAPVTRYEAIHVPVKGLKTLSGRSLKGGDFQFTLKDGAGAVVQTVSNDAQGNIVFKDRSFTRTGTFLYTIEEVPGTAKGITYDSAKYKLAITVSANGGGLVAEQKLLKDGTPTAGGITFANRAKLPKTGDSALQPILLLALAGTGLLVFDLLRRRQQEQGKR